MQTRNESVKPRHGGLGPWILMLIWTFLAIGGSALAAPLLTLTDGDGVLNELPLGTDLYVEAIGLPPSSAVEVVLLDWNGAEILRETRDVGGQGILRPKRLWYRTGIGGCDCKIWGQGYPFRYPTEALSMIGYEVAVQVLDGDTGDLLAQNTLTVTSAREPLVYTADVRGCPRERFERDDALVFLSMGASPAMTVFLVPHQESWEEGDPILDVRQGYRKGQSFQASADGLSGVLWQGVESEVGEYDLLIRPGANPVQPGDLKFLSADRVHPFFGGESGNGGAGGRGNGGLVIDDWGCHWP